MNKNIEKLNIGAIGWFSNLNAGDDRIGEVLIKLFYPHKVILIDQNLVNPYVINQLDLCVFTAGVWHPRYHIAKNFSKWSKYIKVPIIAIGLGVEFGSEKIQHSYNNFINTANLVIVRDKESRKALGNSEKIVVAPDITWSFPFPIINNPLLDTGVVYVNFRPQKKYDIETLKAMKAIINKKFKSSTFYSFSPEDCNIAHGCNYKEIVHFDQRPCLSNVKLIIGMRFHSAVFAGQMCIPHLNIPYHSKVERLTRENPTLINFSEINNLEQFEESIERIDFTILQKEKEILLERREEMVTLATKSKSHIHDFLSTIKKQTRRTSLRYRIYNKLISESERFLL